MHVQRFYGSVGGIVGVWVEMSKDIPIIFSAPMIRALLDGHKTMTRRVLNPQPEQARDGNGNLLPHGILHVEGDPRPRITIGRVITRQEVKYAPGDRLWVREQHWRFGRWLREFYQVDKPERWRFVPDGGKADPARSRFERPHNAETRRAHDVRGWWSRPSIFLPRELSRITLNVTATKIEMLHDISYEDSLAEGMPDFGAIPPAGNMGPTENETMDDCARRLRWPQRWYADLWRELHGVDSWKSNPEVVAPTFTVHQQNIDTMPKAEAA